MISFLTESWFPAKRNGDFQAPDKWWILPRIIHLLFLNICPKRHWLVSSKAASATTAKATQDWIRFTRNSFDFTMKFFLQTLPQILIEISVVSIASTLQSLLPSEYEHKVTTELFQDFANIKATSPCFPPHDLLNDLPHTHLLASLQKP